MTVTETAYTHFKISIYKTHDNARTLAMKDSVLEIAHKGLQHLSF
jgi:hypothetical protein